MAILRETMEVAGSVLVGVAAAAAMEMIMAVVVQPVARIVTFPEGTVQMQKVPRPFFFCSSVLCSDNHLQGSSKCTSARQTGETRGAPPPPPPPSLVALAVNS
jgi:hypothetical protein